MSADVPKPNENVERPQEVMRVEPDASSGDFADDLTGCVLNASLLELVEVSDIAEGEVILKNPEGNLSIAVEIVLHEGAHLLLVGELSVHDYQGRGLCIH